jgi:gliding motility-associated-like protein
MILKRLLLLIGLFTGALLRAQDPCDPPLSASISVSGPVCANEPVVLTFQLPDDDGDGFDVTYRIGAQEFVLNDILDGHSVEHIVPTAVNATLLLVINNDDDDDDECFTNFNQSVLIQVSNLSIALQSQQDPACGQSNGSITATASNGLLPYAYSLNNGPFQPDGAFSNLPAGDYTVVAQDGAGCTASVGATLQSSGAPQINANPDQPDCGASNGSIQADAQGGTPPYQFSLNNGPFQPDGFFDNLPAGNYTVVVMDALDCTDGTSISLSASNAPDLNLSADPPACGLPNGSIQAGASSGAPPYEYRLNNGPFQPSGLFENLPAGTYVVLVRDAAGCTAQATLVLNSVNAPNLTILSQTDPDCGQSNGSVTLSASGGTLPYQYRLGSGPLQPNPVFNGLPAGNYQFFVLDGAGCLQNLQTTLNDPGANLPAATADVNTTQGCSNTSFELSGNLLPGSSGAWSSEDVPQSPPSGAVWNLNGLNPGIYTFVWTLSAPGCANYDTAQLQIEVRNDLQANFDGVYTVTQGAGSMAPVLSNDDYNGPLSLQVIRPPSQGTVSVDQNLLNYQPFPEANGPDTLVYEICYADCADLCDTAMVFFLNIRNEDPCVITGDTSNLFTNGLTPNGDGLNDVLVFRVVSVEDCEINYAKSEIIIYNRWGDIVFEASPYNNDWGGEGRSGDALPPGVYYFVLRITLDRVYTQFGSVILLR